MKAKTVENSRFQVEQKMLKKQQKQIRKQEKKVQEAIWLLKMYKKGEQQKIVTKIKKEAQKIWTEKRKSQINFYNTVTKKSNKQVITNKYKS